MMTASRFTVWLLAGLFAVGSNVALAADAEKGKKVFNKCKACHFADKDKNKVGPHLIGIFGRPAASLEGFKYSDSLKESGIVWDEKTIGEPLLPDRVTMIGSARHVSPHKRRTSSPGRSTRVLT